MLYKAVLKHRTVQDQNNDQACFFMFLLVLCYASGYQAVQKDNGGQESGQGMLRGPSTLGPPPFDTRDPTLSQKNPIPISVK